MKSKLKEFNKTHNDQSLNEFNMSGLGSLSYKKPTYAPLFFKEIISLREKISEFEKDINEIIKNEMMFFKEKYDTLKMINPKHSFQYDLIFAALFGNGIIV